MHSPLYTPDTLRHTLANMIEQMTPNEGVTTSCLHDVALFRANTPVPRKPIIYAQCLCLIFQGEKTCYLGDTTLPYGPERFLVVPHVLPVESEVRLGPDNSPALALTIAIDHQDINELVGSLGTDSTPSCTEHISTNPGMYLENMTVGIMEPAYRLLQSLHSESEANVLGRQAVREILFRLLQGDHGRVLASAANVESPYAKISSILRQLHLAYADQMDVARLAQSVNMSPSTFHRHFKAVTSYTPVQYLKRIRLEKARELITLQGHPAKVTAHMVGYESPSQFSREFKRHFGFSPKDVSSPNISTVLSTDISPTTSTVTAPAPVPI